MAEIARSGQRNPTEGGGNYPQGSPGGRVDYPSTRYRSYNGLGFLTVGVPDNWRKLGDNNSVWFSPEGGYGQHQNQAVFTHGVNFGVAQTQNRDLRQATDELIQSLAQGNRSLRQSTNFQRVTVSGRTGLSAGLTNVNEATGQTETITLITTQLRNGGLFYMVAVAPQSEARSFASAFNNILRSVRVND
jgi:hypothetical protein